MEILNRGGHPIDWFNPPSPTDFCSTDLIAGDGVRFEGSFRTVAHWRWMDGVAQKRYGTSIHMIQPCYNSSNPLSAGTHDFDVLADWRIDGVPWLEQQRFGRACGEFVWWRHTGPWSSPSAFHCHGGPLPLNRRFATKVGIFVPGQLVDYYAHAWGLAGMHTPGSDPTWHPTNIDSTIFNLDAYVRQQQEAMDMSYEDWTAKGKAQFANDVAALLKKSNDELTKRPLVVRTPDGGDSQTITVKQGWARAANGPAVTRVAAKDSVQALKDVQADDKSNG